MKVIGAMYGSSKIKAATVKLAVEGSRDVSKIFDVLRQLEGQKAAYRFYSANGHKTITVENGTGRAVSGILKKAVDGFKK